MKNFIEDNEDEVSEKLEEIFLDWDEAEIEEKLHTKFHLIDDMTNSKYYYRRD